MKLCELIEILEKEFPKENAYQWDNVGLLAGDSRSEVKKVLVTLDITEAIVEEAINEGCDLILSHHPMLFSGTKSVTADTREGRILISAIKNNVNIYAAHTNCDVAPKGINAKLAELFELNDVLPLEENGLGRVGQLKEECTLTQFADKVKSVLKLDFVRICGDKDKIIKTVALGSGACSDCIPSAIEKNADVMVTGDTKYHNILDAVADGISVIDAGHYGTEIIVCDIFESLLSPLGLEVIKSNSKDVYFCR